MKAFVFEVTDGSAVNEVAIVADSQDDAETEMRVRGIFFGGISFKLNEVVERCSTSL